MRLEDESVGLFDWYGEELEIGIMGWVVCYL